MRILFFFVILMSAVFVASGQNTSRCKIKREYCKNNKCAVFAYVEPAYYDAAGMQQLTGELANKYKDKTVVNLRIFDDEKVVESILSGKREFRNIQTDSRAYFIHKKDCGDMLFYKTESKEIKSVKLGWKIESKCNQPFTIF